MASEKNEIKEKMKDGEPRSSGNNNGRGAGRVSWREKSRACRKMRSIPNLRQVVCADGNSGAKPERQRQIAEVSGRNNNSRRAQRWRSSWPYRD
jgi:hypothetical protein